MGKGPNFLEMVARDDLSYDKRSFAFFQLIDKRLFLVLVIRGRKSLGIVVTMSCLLSAINEIIRGVSVACY